MSYFNGKFYNFIATIVMAPLSAPMNFNVAHKTCITVYAAARRDMASLRCALLYVLISIGNGRLGVIEPYVY